MRVWWVAFVLLAGCTDSPQKGQGDDNAVAVDEPFAPSSTPVTLEACTALEVIMVGDADAARPYVPADFTVPDNPLVIVGGFLCGEDNSVAERGLVAIQVTPNDPALESPGATIYFWEPEHYLGANDTLGDLLLAAHANATSGMTTITVGTTDTAMTITSGEIGYSWQSAVGPAPLGTDLIAQALRPFREYMAADGGYAYLDASFAGEMAPAGLSPGTLTITGDTVGSTLFGASSRQIAGVLTELEYAGAVVGYIPWD